MTKKTVGEKPTNIHIHITNLIGTCIVTQSADGTINGLDAAVQSSLTRVINAANNCTMGDVKTP